VLYLTLVGDHGDWIVSSALNF